MVTQTTRAANGTEVLQREHVRRGPTFRPDVDIYETDNEIALIADMPGVTAEAVDIRFDNGMLTINGRVEPRKGEECECLIREFAVGDYTRSFQVDEDIDASGISAELSNGVLTVRLPKAESAKPRRIPVQVQSQGPSQVQQPPAAGPQRQMGSQSPQQPQSQQQQQQQQGQGKQGS